MNALNRVLNYTEMCVNISFYRSVNSFDNNGKWSLCVKLISILC